MKFSTTQPARSTAAFTMMEVAICLAIIGFALVAIIGVLPIGLNTQRDNREETVINQDATVLMEVIRSGARGADFLTNYVYAITNNGVNIRWNKRGYDSTYLTNGANIIGLLSAPEFLDNNGNPSPYFAANGTSNHVVAYVRSLSGLAAEKPPQDNQIMREDTFTYRLFCVNAPMAFDTKSSPVGFARQLLANQHELRLTFLWPQLPNGNLGSGRQTFRATIAGQLSYQPTNGLPTYFYQSQSFTNAP
jgi:type II secretory pathway pseudopilin PulG